MALSKKSRKMNANSKEWVASSSTREDLEEMVMDGILPDEVTTEWRPAEGEHFPNPRVGKLVIFLRIFIIEDLGFQDIHSCTSCSRTMGFHSSISTQIQFYILLSSSIYVRPILV